MFPVRDANTNALKFVAPARAIVVDISDPDALGRIRVNSPIVGETNWIPYLQLPNCFFIPSVGDMVYIQCDGGFAMYPVAFGSQILEKSENEGLPNFLRKLPTNQGVYTPGGHLIEYDDGKGPQADLKGIRITTSDGSKIHISEYTNNKKILLERQEGTKVEIDGQTDMITISANNGDILTVSKDEGIQGSTPSGTALSMKNGIVTIEGEGSSLEIKDASIIATDSNGNTVTLDSSGSKIEDSNGNAIEMTSSGIKATDSAGAGLNISSGKVALGGSAAEVLDLFDKLLQQMDAILTQVQAITVPTAVGPSGPPVNAAAFASAQVQVATIKTTLGSIKGSI